MRPFLSGGGYNAIYGYGFLVYRGLGLHENYNMWVT